MSVAMQCGRMYQYTCILADDSVKSKYFGIYRCHKAVLNYLVWAIMLYKLLTFAQGIVLEALG